VLSALGAGGMGEVYRAKDTRLGREIALKILPPHVAADPSRHSRFEQEARAVAALNHPNIVSVFDIGESGGIAYIVSELIEGTSLRDVTLTTRKIVDVAAQVADGLAAAHRAGITHRDLKPDNIMLTPDGRAKILDFGLAKVTPKPSDPGRLNEQETAIISNTQSGVVMGTVGYMSPEQVRAKPLDPRSDIFSFGLVFYELLANQHPFLRESSAEVMSAIVREEPADLPSTINPALADIIRHCLEKDPANRFQSAQDLAFHLKALAGRASASAPAPAYGLVRRVSSKYMLYAAASVIAIWSIAATALWLNARRHNNSLESYRFTPFVAAAQPASQPVWSPDGRSVAFVMEVDRVNQIFIRPVDAQVHHQLTKMAHSVMNPMWTPDALRLYFISEQRLWSMGIAGGEPEPVMTDVISAALSPDGQTLAFMRTAPKNGVETTSIWISSPPGSDPKEYLPAPISSPGRMRPMKLAFSPDGRQLLASCQTTNSPEVWLIPFPMGQGHARQLFVKQLSNVLDLPSFSWMPDSRHVVLSMPTPKGFDSELWMADVRSESLERLTADNSTESQPAVSPDGKKIVFASTSDDYNMVEIPLDGGPSRSLLSTSRSELFPAWPPDGDEYAYVTDRSGESEIWMRNRRTSADRPLITPKEFAKNPPSQFFTPEFSPDGNSIAFAATGNHQVASIWISPTEGGTPVPLTNDKSEGFELAPTWSPDGNWIAYATLIRGQPLTRMKRVGSQEPPVDLLHDGCAPRWSPLGDWIICGDTPDGFKLVSADGSKQKVFPHIFNIGSTWSADGSQIFGLTWTAEGSRLQVLTFQTGAVRTVRDFSPEIHFATNMAHSLRLSLAPDHKSFSTTTVETKSDLWILEGFAKP
jgi:serine/threonine protein kinase/Tol biopolymer transport system component